MQIAPRLRTVTQNDRFRWLILVQGIWLALVFLMAAWWGYLLRRQAARIQELEILVGPGGNAHLQWAKTERMLMWEQSAFLLLIALISSILFWLVWRDLRRSRSIQAFFASVTHELRTPLTSIRLQAESIADSLGDTFGGRSPNQEVQSLIGRLLQDTSRLEAQVERTLELARVEGGGVLHLQGVDLSQWLKRAESQYLSSSEFQAGPKVSLDASVRDARHEVLADPAALHVIFKNILENAVRHSRKDAVEIKISATELGEAVKLNFVDNGENTFSEGNDVSPRLGGLFQKGSQSTGTGVGLYLIQALQKKMGGQAHFGFHPSTKGFQVELVFKKFLGGRDG